MADFKEVSYFAHKYESIEMLADRISEALLCPITIEDANHQIIAYSRHEGDIDPVRIATIMRRRVPEPVINSLWKSGAIPQLFKTSDPVVIPAINQVALGERVAISVRKQQKVIGFIWAQSSAPFTDEQFFILKQAAEAVQNQLMQYEKRKKAVEESHQEFLWKLLTGHFTSKNDIEQENEPHGLLLTGQLVAVVFDFSQTIDSKLERQVEYLAETLQQVFCTARTYNEEQLVLLIRFADQADMALVAAYIQNFQAKALERLGLLPAGAAGSIAESPLFIQNSYQEALHVLQVKQLFPETEIPACFDKIGIFQEIEALRQIRAEKNNGTLNLLEQYDFLHQTNMVETLYFFLKHDGNVNAAAKKLHIHPNTLSYRIKKITEMTGFHPKDVNEKTLLWIDLLVNRANQFTDKQ